LSLFDRQLKSGQVLAAHDVAQFEDKADCRIAPIVELPQSTATRPAIGALAHDPIEPELGGVAAANAAGRDIRRA
jgi:hypothetical protein